MSQVPDGVLNMNKDGIVLSWRLPTRGQMGTK